MSRIRISIAGSLVALLLVACGSDPEPEKGSSEAGGTAGVGGTSPYGGTGGSVTGGFGGSATGGFGASGVGGGPGGTGGLNPGGGTGGLNPGGGTGGLNPGGGTGGLNPGGTGGLNPGGTGGAPSGGTGGMGASGAGDPFGGTGGMGAADTGGVGASGTGGEGTGGAPPVDEPTLVTSGPNAYWQDEEEPTVTTGNADITVNEGTEYQDWDGWGGTFNEAGWDALKVLSQEDRDYAIRLLFSKAEGCGFTFGRIPIGSSDYGLSRYTLDDMPAGQTDPNMDHFSIDRDKENLIPYIKAAMEVKPDIHFWGSPWTPPPWMKDNGAYDRGAMKTDALAAHALYLTRWVQAYADEGITVEAVHPQNEPGYPQDYPSCTWTAQQYVQYIGTHLGPLFAQELPNTKIWLGTMSNANSYGIVTSVMNDNTARSYVSGIGLQWAQDRYAEEYIRNYSVPVWQTEHQCGNFPNGSNANQAPNDHAYGIESWGLIKKWIGYGVNAYSAWNMVLDTRGRNLDEVRPWAQNALLAVDRNANRLIVTPAYYVFRHFAGFVDPGAKRIGVNGSNDALAFKNPDGTIVVVMYNSGGSARQTTVGVGGTTLQFSVPGQGWATVNWQ